MGVLSRTMLMLSIAWLVGLNVTFIYLSASPEPNWRDKFLAEANIRRAIAYRCVDINGGVVADRGMDRFVRTTGDNDAPDATDAELTPESVGAAPMGEGAGGSTDPLPGSSISSAQSLIQIERNAGNTRGETHAAEVSGLNTEIETLTNDIGQANRSRSAALTRMGEIRDEVAFFAAEMEAYRYVISSFQQKVFNLDYEIQRVLVERDALAAELSQVKNDTKRVKEQELTLEDSYYQLSRSYEKNIRVIAMYEQLDPNIRRLADVAGRGWLYGRVTSVGDDPRSGVVSISLGAQDGVEEGQVFTVHRKGKFLARMRVEEVEDNYAVGRLLREFRGKVTVVENDSIKSAEAFGGATLGKND